MIDKEKVTNEALKLFVDLIHKLEQLDPKDFNIYKKAEMMEGLDLVIRQVKRLEGDL